MSIELLQGRLQELDQAIANTTQSIYVLQGHKQEVVWQMGEMERLKAEEDKSLECETVTAV